MIRPHSAPVAPCAIGVCFYGPPTTDAMPIPAFAAPSFADSASIKAEPLHFSVRGPLEPAASPADLNSCQSLADAQPVPGAGRDTSDPGIHSAPDNASNEAKPDCLCSRVLIRVGNAGAVIVLHTTQNHGILERSAGDLPHIAINLGLGAARSEQDESFSVEGAVRGHLRRAHCAQ